MNPSPPPNLPQQTGTHRQQCSNINSQHCCHHFRELVSHTHTHVEVRPNTHTLTYTNRHTHWHTHSDTNSQTDTHNDTHVHRASSRIWTSRQLHRVTSGGGRDGLTTNTKEREEKRKKTRRKKDGKSVAIRSAQSLMISVVVYCDRFKLSGPSLRVLQGLSVIRQKEQEAQTRERKELGGGGKGGRGERWSNCDN